MTTTAAILEHIDALPDEEIIATRDLLHLGFRDAVDKATSRLVKLCVLVPIARGLFIKAGAQIPSAIEVAIAKARAFGKELVTHGQTAAREMELIPSDEGPTFIYQVNGRSSSFQFIGGRIYLRGCVPKKMAGGETTVGKVVRALSSLGKSIRNWQLMRALSYVDAQEYQLVLKSARWMSAWLADDVREALLFKKNASSSSRALAE